jgi:hypothetical protein
METYQFGPNNMYMFLYRKLVETVIPPAKKTHPLDLALTSDGNTISSIFTQKRHVPLVRKSNLREYITYVKWFKKGVGIKE